MFPTEIYHYIISMLGGFERENMRVVCRTFNEFKFTISTKNPAKDREVLLIDCDKRFYELFEYGHSDIISQCYGRYGDIAKTFKYACKYGYTELAIDIYEDHWNEGIPVSLKESCKSGNIDTIKMAIEYGAKDFTKGLGQLCRIGRLDLFEYLLTLSDDNPELGDLICGACESGNMDMVKRVMEFQQDDDDIWDLALRYACKGGNIDIVNLIISKGGTDFIMGFSGACKGGNINIAKYMIEIGARAIDCFEIACINGNAEIVKMLMEKIHLNNKLKTIGFSRGILCGHVEIVKMFSEGSFNEHCLLGINEGFNLEVLEYLISKGAKITEKTFSSIVKHGDMNHVKLLVKNGAKVTREIIKIAKQTDRRIYKYLKSI